MSVNLSRKEPKLNTMYPITINDSIGGITVITNTGETHCLIKTNKYNFEEAYNVLSDIRREFNASTPNSEEDAEIVKRFIKSSKKTGIVSL